MSYGNRTTGFNMDEEFVGSHIDENGFISFTQQKPQKKMTKDDHIYGVWNSEVEESVFKGQKQLAKTTLAMNFRKSGQIQHDPDTGIRVKQAVGKLREAAKQQEEQQSTKSSNLRSKVDTQKKDTKQKKSVKFDEGNLQENEIMKQKKKQVTQFGFDNDSDPLSYDAEEQDEDDDDQMEQRMNQKAKYMKMFSKGLKEDDEEDEVGNQNDDDNDDEEEGDDDEDEGFSKGKKNKLFFKSSKKQEKNQQKSILKQKSQLNKIKNSYDADLEDLNDLGSGDDNENNEDENAYEDQDEKFQFSKSSQSSQIQLTKEQMRKRKIYNFKRNREDEDDAILEEQSQQFNLPLRFGQQRKQFKKKSDAEIEEESKGVVNLETKFESNESKIHAENYGKGFSMLQKMGFKVGKGIGKDEQGIAKPVEANFKQSFTMYDNYQQMEKDNKKILKELGIDVEEELDNFDNVYSEFKKNQQSEFGDYDEENTIEFEKTYVKKNEENKRFPNRFFAHLNKKSRQAKQGSLTDIGVAEQTIKSDSSLQSTSNIGSSSNMKIIDMRGNSTVTYDNSKGSGFSEFFAASKILDTKSLAKQDNPIFSEMLFNLKNKMDKTKGKKMNLSSKLKIEQDRIVQVQYEEQQLIEQTKNHSKVMKQTENILNKLQNIRQNEDNLSCSDILQSFKEMFEESDQQFAHFNLEQLLVGQITSCLTKKFEQLTHQQKSSNRKSDVDNREEEEMDLGESEDEDYINEKSSRNSRSIQSTQNFMTDLNKLEIKKSVELIQEADKLLAKIFLFKQNQNLMKYESELSGNITLKRDTILNEKNERIIQRYVQYIINRSFMPHLKNYMIKVFNPTNLKSNNEIIDCLEEYQKILPPAVISDLVQSFILPKLNDAVKKWNPVKNEGRNLQNDVDLWLIPWITIITPIDLLKDTFKLVLAKYSQVLSKWEVEDKSMYDKLKPWKTIISESQWNDLMLKQIIPKLQFYLDQLEINPSDQKDLNVVQNIVLWCDLLQPKDICNIMEDTILVKLAEVLMEWLSSEDVDTSEVKTWVASWKSLLGDKIMQIDSFQSVFTSFNEKIDEL